MKTIAAAAAHLSNPELIGTAFCQAYTSEIDDWVRSIVDQVEPAEGFALAAVGGYGRGDLTPGSDLDLLLIHKLGSKATPIAKQIWYPIWDSGMKVGHAVRTIDEALSLAAEDLDTATSLLEMRCLGGDPSLVDELQEKALHQWQQRKHKQLDNLAERIRERHRDAGECAFLLEPDLKLSQGGLRDVNSLRWMDLADSTLLDDEERQALLAPHDTLLAARSELHRATGRSGNQLLLQDQDEVAAALQLDDADHLMAAVAGAARTIAWIQDSVLHRIHQRGRRRRWLSKTKDLGHGIQLIDDTLSLTEDADVTDPVLMLRVALHAAQTEAFIERDVLRQIAEHGGELPDPWPDEARELFVDLLLCGHDMIGVVEALDHFDLVTRLIPEWAPNRNRPQRNAYHRFTVDRHLLEAAAEAARLADQVVRPDLLVMGGLFHDIGKGYPGDHSEVGVGLMNTIATRMGYSSADTSALETLVRHHLLLPDVASRRDLEDEGTIRHVAEAVRSVGTVELLAALTQADSIATSKSAWNSWKAELVSDLTSRTIRFLQGDPLQAADDFPPPELLALAESGQTTVTIDGQIVTAIAPDRPGVFSRVAGALALHGVEILGANLSVAHGMAIDVIRVSGGPGLSERPEDVIADVLRALRRELALTARLDRRARSYRLRRAKAAQVMEPAVLIDNDVSDAATVLEVRGPDSIGFLYRVTRAFVELDLDIVQAKVQTLGADVVDTFYVLDDEGKKVTDPEYLAEVELAVLSAIAADPQGST